MRAVAAGGVMGAKAAASLWLGSAAVAATAVVGPARHCPPRNLKLLNRRFSNQMESSDVATSVCNQALGDGGGGGDVGGGGDGGGSANSGGSGGAMMRYELALLVTDRAPADAPPPLPRLWEPMAIAAALPPE